MKVTAAVVESKGAPFVQRELELGPLRDDEVLVEVAAAGICHTDLICRDQWIPTPLPAVLGHEGAGVVVAVGSAVTKVGPGDRVGMTFTACGDCPCCRAGKSCYCHAFFEYNFAASRPADGSSVFGDVGAHFFGQSSFATHSVAAERDVVKLPDGIELEVAAPFGCGIQTGAGAVLNSLAAPPGSTLAVYGAGSVGLAAILAGAIAGCSAIVAVDVVPERLALALELGATHAIDAGERRRRRRGQGGDRRRRRLRDRGDRAAGGAAPACRLDRAARRDRRDRRAGVRHRSVARRERRSSPGGRVVRGIVEGDSVPDEFLPRLVRAAGRGQVSRSSA